MDLFTHLYTPLGTTSNYSAIAHLHILQITNTPKYSQSSLDVTSQRLLTVEILQLPGLSFSCHSRPSRTLTSSLKYSAISSQPPLQSPTQLPILNWTLSLAYQLLHFTSLHSTELPSVGLGFSLHSLGADPTENTASKISSMFVMDGCLAIARISLTCLLAVTKQRMFLFAIVA
jgi:hypothetical protein